jgi:hypothetical protein
MLMSDDSSPRLDAPLPLRDVLTYPVVLSVSNYVALAFLNISISALLPLFLAMPLSVGGLGFSPATIGYIIGSYGAASGIFQALYFSKIVRCFGERRVYICAISTMAPVFLLLPIISLLARQWGLSPIVWVFIVFLLVLLSLLDMAYGKSFLCLLFPSLITFHPLNFRLHIHVHYSFCTKQTLTWSHQRVVPDNSLNSACHRARDVYLSVFILCREEHTRGIWRIRFLLHPLSSCYYSSFPVA